MIDGVVKLCIAVGAGIAAWYADKYCKEKTGKHIHEHVADFVKDLWNGLKGWARQYLSEHDEICKIYVSTVNIAAQIKRSYNEQSDTFLLKVFGLDRRTGKSKVISEEEMPLSEAQGILEQSKVESCLAQ